MLKKRILLSVVVIAALTLPSLAEETTPTALTESEMAASAESTEEETDLLEEPEEVEEEESAIEISGYLKAEGSVFTKSGTTYNPKAPHKSGDIMKGEGTLKLFVNGSLGEDSSFHAELQAIGDTEGIDGYEHHRNYTQYDAIRELYIDTTYADWDFRLGKQQVVWGKADGVKFLDIINPTDFREWGQNTMEDSRIPLWMAVAEKDLGNNDSIQFVWVPDVGRVNQIPGLHNTNTGDQGQPFVSLGADTMTGQYNGFVNIGNDMGRVAGAFDAGFSGAIGIPPGNNILANFSNMTVSQFTNMQDISVLPLPNPLPPITGGQMLDGVIMQTGSTTNLNAGTGTYDYQNAMHMFEYMGDTTFATFDGFVGMQTSYRVDDISRNLEDHNFGVRYKKGTDFGLNYTLNFYRHWDNNPMVNMHWEGAAGQRLNTNNTVGSFDGLTGAPVAPGTPGSYQTNTVGLENTDGSAYNSATDGPATLVMQEGINQVNTYGASFDYAVDTSFAPIVIRGEFVYDQGSKVPEVDLGKLAYGDIAGAMTMADADIFKYVIGADVTVATNLFISFQFMDIWNLDYMDSEVQYEGNSQSYGRFTANPATMSLGNGFKKAEEHQIMYTLFLSKPFLESDSMRVNNLFLYEQDDGGYWNRLDLEYSYADDILLSAEWNQYGGDQYGVFGQFADMSNFQLGIKYIF